MERDGSFALTKGGDLRAEVAYCQRYRFFGLGNSGSVCLPLEDEKYEESPIAGDGQIPGEWRWATGYLL